MEAKQLAAIMDVQIGIQIALLHTFTCLHHKGVISLSEAAESFEGTAKALPQNSSAGTRLIVGQMARSLRMLAEQNTPPNPAGPPPATRPDLRLIQGGRTE